MEPKDILTTMSSNAMDTSGLPPSTVCSSSPRSELHAAPPWASRAAPPLLAALLTAGSSTPVGASSRTLVRRSHEYLSRPGWLGVPPEKLGRKSRMRGANCRRHGRAGELQHAWGTVRQGMAAWR